MGNYSYSINKNLFSFTFINETDEKHEWKDRDNWSHYIILDKLLDFMKERGFDIGRDPEIEEYYSSLSKDYWYGIKKDLEFKAKRYPRGFSIEFFQNINFENRNGGEYDFDKFDKAPYLIRLMWIKETEKMAECIQGIIPDAIDETDNEYKNSEDKVKNHLVESWHKPQKDMNFKLSDLDGATCEGNYNNTDRDGKTIYNGEIKYFRDYRGRLIRGKVYHNINNMWWVILNDTDYTNVADFKLFDPTEEDFKHRRIQKNKVESYETSRVAARKKFNNNLTYKDVTRKEIEKLHELVAKEIEEAAGKGECLETMKIHPKIRTRCKSNKKIIRAFLYVDSHYFEKRECISFNENGFIGFAGWAGESNIKPILKGFCKWCDYMIDAKVKE